jgi:glycosyltransferase involved in cell wall biosynthesis
MRVRQSAIGNRCRFLGDLSKETFEAILAASDFVVIPARTRQDEGLARAAIARGLPVLTTHQAGIKCIVHGKNGLVTFDNPGSIVWGIQEMLHNPLHGSMLRFFARKKAGETLSVEIAAAQHFMHYEMLLKSIEENINA